MTVDQRRRRRDTPVQLTGPLHLACVRVERLHQPVPAAKEDDISGNSGTHWTRAIAAVRAAEAFPLQPAGLEVDCDEPILRGHGEHGVAASDQIARDPFIHTEFPSNGAGGSLERVDVTFRQVGIEDDEIVADDRIAVKARVLIGVSVVLPPNRTGVLVEGVEDPGAGSNEQQVPSDRWGDGQSAPCVVLPQHLEARRGRLRSRVRRNGNDSREQHVQDQPTAISQHRRSVVVAHTKYLRSKSSVR